MPQYSITEAPLWFIFTKLPQTMWNGIPPPPYSQILFECASQELCGNVHCAMWQCAMCYVAMWHSISGAMWEEDTRGEREKVEAALLFCHQWRPKQSRSVNRFVKRYSSSPEYSIQLCDPKCAKNKYDKPLIYLNASFFFLEHPQQYQSSQHHVRPLIQRNSCFSGCVYKIWSTNIISVNLTSIFPDLFLLIWNIWDFRAWRTNIRIWYESHAWMWTFLLLKIKCLNGQLGKIVIHPPASTCIHFCPPASHASNDIHFS